MRLFFEWTERQLGELEAEYRQHYLAADINQTRMFIAIVVLANLAFIPIDLSVLQGQPLLLPFALILRGFMISCSIGFAFLLRRIHTPARYDQLVFGYTLIIVIAQGISAATRPASYYGTFTFDIILILYIYLLIPNTWLYRTICAVIASIISLVTLFLMREPSLLYTTSIPVAIFGIHLIGLSSSARSYNYRRQEYQAIHTAELLNQRLTILAEIDSLTGAFNRRKFLELGADEFQRYQRYGHRFALMLADVDLFKRINDQYGHAAGDVVLTALVQTMLTSRRANDAVGRLGGEEFALLLPETTLSAAVLVAERLRQHVQDSPIAAEQQSLSVTFSAGVVECSPDDHSFMDVLRRADQLLYQAKAGGRNCIKS